MICELCAEVKSAGAARLLATHHTWNDHDLLGLGVKLVNTNGCPTLRDLKCGGPFCPLLFEDAFGFAHRCQRFRIAVEQEIRVPLYAVIAAPGHDS